MVHLVLHLNDLLRLNNYLVIVNVKVTLQIPSLDLQSYAVSRMQTLQSARGYAFHSLLICFAYLISHLPR